MRQTQNMRGKFDPRQSFQSNSFNLERTFFNFLLPQNIVLIQGVAKRFVLIKY